MQASVGLQVFGLLDMHQQLDGQMDVLSDVLSNTNSGSLLRVGFHLLVTHHSCWI